MKKTKIAALLLALTLALGVFAGCTNETPVVSIGDVKITQPVFDYLMGYYCYDMIVNVEALAQDPSALYTAEVAEGVTAYQWILSYGREYATRLTVFMQKAEEMGIALTEEDKEAIKTNKQLQVTSIGGRTFFKQWLNSIGTNEESYDKFMEIEKLYQKVSDTVSAEIPVEDSALRAIYDEDYIGAQHILIETVDADGNALPQEEITAARTKAEEILKEAKSGKDFYELMKEHSDDRPDEASDPSEYYIFTTGEMVEEFETAAFELEVDEISEIVTTKYGYHIIKRINVEDDKYFEEAKESIREVYLYQELEKLYTEWKDSYEITIDDEYIGAYVFG